MDQQHRIPKTVLAALLTCGLAMSGCKSNEPKPAESTAPAQQAPQQAETPPPQPAPAAQKPICKEEPKTTSKKAKTKSKTAKTAPPAQPTDCVPASQAAAAPAPEPAAAQAPSTSTSYNLSKNKPVTDSTKVQSGEGTMVKGINDWEGEITGIPAPGGKFAKLKIGMLREEVFGLIGQPTDQGAYITGKAWIPFYHGSDRVRWEAIYKGQGRLIFSQQAGWASSSFHLTWIIHSANEVGNR